jgi:hypothetical protein
MKQYLVIRLAELDALIAEHPEGSNHRYALMAGKFELLRMATELNL